MHIVEWVENRAIQHSRCVYRHGSIMKSAYHVKRTACNDDIMKSTHVVYIDMVASCRMWFPWVPTHPHLPPPTTKDKHNLKVEWLIIEIFNQIQTNM